MCLCVCVCVCVRARVRVTISLSRSFRVRASTRCFFCASLDLLKSADGSCDNEQ